MKTTALLVAVLAVTSLSTVIANTVCVNGNTQITKLYVDGEDYTNKLARRLDPFHCDCLSLPNNTGIIAIRARCNAFQVNTPGIQFCQTDEYAQHGPWVCAQSKDTKKIDGKKWYEAGYSTRNPQVWSKATRATCQRPCRHKKVLPCLTDTCFWTEQKFTSVSCIRKSSASGPTIL